MNDTLIVMGNGPSLKTIDFKLFDGYDTFGLNSAYRAYEKLNWYPTYHGCFDYVVTDSHKTSFIKLIETNKIKRHFYIKDIAKDPRVTHINLIPYGSSNKNNTSEEDFAHFHDNGNSGANACSVGICLGYKKIILVGVDCNYTEIIDGAIEKNGKLEIANNPSHNPNYWFDDYQQVGDQYNVPRGQSFHKPTWTIFSKRAKDLGIEVINCSLISTLNCFKKMNIEQALKE